MAGKLKEGFYALFFLIAIGLLAYNTFGVLTIPGYIMAVTAIILIYYKNHYGAALIGIMTAAGSFIAQYITYYCPYCTAAAFCFLIGGLINMYGKYEKCTPLSIISTICITSALTLFIFSPVLHYGSSQNYEYEEEVIISDKPLLYVSQECRACEDIVDYMIEYDSVGEKWSPVVLGDIDKGAAYLAQKGYEGELLSASHPPGNTIPVLVVEDGIYEGYITIKDYFEEEVKEWR